MIQGPQAGGHHSPLCPCLPSPHRSEGQCPWDPSLQSFPLPPGLSLNPPSLPSSSPWGWWRGLHFMSGRKRLLLLWQLGEFWLDPLGPLGRATSAEQGPYPSPLQSSLHPPCSPCAWTKCPTGNERGKGFAGRAWAGARAVVRAAGSSPSPPGAQPAPCAGRRPSTETSSSRRGCWPLKTCAKPIEDHLPREESTPLSLLRPPADTSVRWPDEPAWPSPAAPKARPARVLHGPLLTGAGIVLFMKMMQKHGGVPSVGSKALNSSSLPTHRGLFGAECKGGCWLPREQTPTHSR